jgi:hypothetical protein
MIKKTLQRETLQEILKRGLEKIADINRNGLILQRCLSDETLYFRKLYSSKGDDITCLDMRRGNYKKQSFEKNDTPIATIHRSSWNRKFLYKDIISI